MKIIAMTSETAAKDIDACLEAAQTNHVCIMESGQPIAYFISEAEFKRLSHGKRRARKSSVLNTARPDNETQSNRDNDASNFKNSEF